MQQNFAFILICLVPFLSGTCIAGRLTQQMSMADGFMGHTRALTQCDSKSKACESVCSCGACGITCNNIRELKLIPENMPNMQLNQSGVLRKLFDNEMLTNALAKMCEASFPAFSQEDLTDKELTNLKKSSYARDFAPACKQFSDAISQQPKGTYFLTIGLPTGGLSLGGVSFCMAVRPGCGDGDLQILMGLAEASVTIPTLPPLALEPVYFGFSKGGKINTPSGKKMWSINLDKLSKGNLDGLDMPSHISLRGAITAGLSFGKKLEIGLRGQITMGINLDTDENGFGGSDFGLLFDIQAAPIVNLKSPEGKSVFKFGGEDGGITATATAYYWRKAEKRRFQLALTASVSIKDLIKKIEINEKPMSKAITSVSGLFNIEANVALYADIAAPKWGAYLYGDFTIDFQLPVKVVNFINNRGWADAVKALPYLGPIFMNGWKFAISGGVMVQDAQDYTGTTKLHIGFVNRGKVTWLDFGLCEQDSDCHDNACCALGFFCIPKSSDICGPTMTLITNGIKEVKQALVNFATFVGKSAEGLWKAASKGVYNFFNSVFGSDSGNDNYWAWKYWNKGNAASNDEFFIRVKTFALTDNSVGVGVDRPGCDTCSIDLQNGWRLQAKRKESLNYAAWWYIQRVGGGADEHIIIKSYKDQSFCWDVPQSSFVEGANLVVYKCNGSSAQQFVIVPFGSNNQGWMSIRPKVAFWLCLEMNEERNSYVVLRPCQNFETQRFAISTS